MDNIWTLDNIKKLFAGVKEAEEKNQSLASVFSQLSKEMNCSTGSVRNYYYSQAKLFRLMPSLARQMGVETASSRAKPFETFDFGEARDIVKTALVNKAKGISVRATLMNMANGDEKKALRFQNKYRSILLHHKKTVHEIMDELRNSSTPFYNPYAKTIVRPGEQTAIAGVLEKVDKLSGEEKEMLLRKILM